LAYQEQIRNTPDPFAASMLGKNRSKPIISDWNSVRYSFMEKAIEAKFRQNTVLRQILLEKTDGKYILCHNPEDGYWGDGIGCGGNHENNLGKILMAVREKLSGEKTG